MCTARCAAHDGVVPNIDVEPYLEAVVDTAREVLGAEFVGAYAAGSLALNAFHPGRSDIDIALLCRDPLSKTVKRELIARLRHSALPCPARGLELVVYTMATAQSGTGEPGFELELNDGPDMAFRQTLQPQTARQPTGRSGTDWTAASCTRAAGCWRDRRPRRHSPSWHRRNYRAYWSTRCAGGWRCPAQPMTGPHLEPTTRSSEPVARWFDIATGSGCPKSMPADGYSGPPTSRSRRSNSPSQHAPVSFRLQVGKHGLFRKACCTSS